MNKIAVIGCGGAGKSNLSIKLGKLISIPVHHLDCMFWKPGWISTDRNEFVKLQNDIFTNDHWIIDGNYGGTMDLRLEQADTIIFLDLPTIVCISGALRRYFKYRNATRPDMTEGNAERITLEFLKYVWTYRTKRQPPIIEKLKNMTKEKKVIILNTRQEIASFLSFTAKKEIQSDVAKATPLT